MEKKIQTKTGSGFNYRSSPHRTEEEEGEEENDCIFFCGYYITMHARGERNSQNLSI